MKKLLFTIEKQENPIIYYIFCMNIKNLKISQIIKINNINVENSFDNLTVKKLDFCDLI